jgi:anti-sigma B factor antagonist
MPSETVRIEKVAEHCWVLTPLGEHDLATQPSLRTQIDPALRFGSRIVVDLSQAEFIDSTVIGALVHGRNHATQRGDDEFLVVAPPGSFTEKVLALAGIADAIPIYPTRDAALAATLPSGAQALGGAPPV